jgi:hypothetical protein
MSSIELTDQERCELVARMVEDLLREHQLAGFFMVAAPTHATHGLLLDSAPWLRLTLEQGADGAVRGFRVRSKIEEYKARGLPEEEARALQKREMEYTISAIDFIALQAAPVSMLLLQALTVLRERFDSQTTSTRVGDAGGKLQ